ncbi:MAG: prepilin-type N-terminal cleavage/methylation domain-containing protein [Parcubacteria group bacterium]|nr:prepilin-type N-terminal cleavage/methylation domain-containing protein [Parcubacteria group bacterium]
MVNRKNKKRGFTLIEMVVSMAVFSVVMLIIVGSLLALVDANKKAQAVKSVMNNLNFALENMSRNIRVGYTYHCSSVATVPPNIGVPNGCSGGGPLLAFEAYDGNSATDTDQVIYRLNGTQIEKSSNGGASFVGITAPEVNITNMAFYVTGSSAFDTKQPRVVITISGTAGISTKAVTSFNIETTVSQRLLDI